MNKVFFETCQLSSASRWNQLAVYDIILINSRRKLTCKRGESSISMLDYVGLFHCSLKIVGLGISMCWPGWPKFQAATRSFSAVQG